VRCFPALILFIFVCGCGARQSDIVGTWTTNPNSGPDLWDRFTFNADGTLVWKWHYKSKKSPDLDNDSEQKGTYKVNGSTIELDLGPEIKSNPRYKPGPAEKNSAKITWVSKDELVFNYPNGTPSFYRVK